MKIATWNINSVRLRIDIVLQFLETHKPDILALQETKSPDEFFPIKSFEKIGYKHTVFSGEKSYNGVAIVSRIPIKHIKTEKFVNADKRHISCELPDGIEFHNFYVPAGGDIPDVKLNPKFAHKLDFVDKMTGFFSEFSTHPLRSTPLNSSPLAGEVRRGGALRLPSQGGVKPSKPIIIVGDFNIAPYEQDVWSHKQLLDVVSHTPIEVEKLNNLKSSLDWVDVMREFVSPDEKLYSWWSYRNRDWKKSNRGRRLDHIWITPGLKPSLKSGSILKEARDFKKPSDHVPVIVELAL